MDHIRGFRKSLKNRHRILRRVWYAACLIEARSKPSNRKEGRQMAKNPRASQTLKKAQRAQSVWQTIPDFKIGSVSLNDFTAAMNAADVLAKQHAKNAVDGAGLKAT